MRAVETHAEFLLPVFHYFELTQQNPVSGSPTTHVPFLMPPFHFWTSLSLSLSFLHGYSVM